jgi:tetratricopeptide (TPR) repeat protein
MYKERRRKWGIEKNIKTEEWQAIIRKFVERANAGKESEIRIRNTQISASKIRQYRKRFKISEKEALTFRALTPTDLVCRTPLVTPPSSPRVFELPEQLARLCRVWIHGSFESKAWTVSNDQLRVESRYSTSSSIYAFFNLSRHAGWCLFDGETKIGFRTLNLAMAQIKNVIAEQDPNTLDLLYHVILKFTLDWKKPEIASMLLRCFHSLSTVILGPGHTFTQICTTLFALDITQLTHALLISFQCRFDQFGQKVGPFNNCTRSSRDLTLVWNNYTGQTTIAQTTEYLSAHLKEYEEALGPFDLRSLQVRIFLANYYLNKNQYNEALNTIQGALDRALKGCIANPDLMCQIFKTLAYIHFGLSEFELAEKNLRYAIDVAARYPCRDSDLRLFKRLGSWLESWNRREDAAQLREQHDTILDARCARLAEEEKNTSDVSSKLDPTL